MSKTVIKLNPDSEYVKMVLKKIHNNGGYCPCKLEKNEDTKCMCTEFRNTSEGMCHCGLYVKEIKTGD